MFVETRSIMKIHNLHECGQFEGKPLLSSLFLSTSRDYSKQRLKLIGLLRTPREERHLGNQVIAMLQTRQQLPITLQILAKQQLPIFFLHGLRHDRQFCTVTQSWITRNRKSLSIWKKGKNRKVVVNVITFSSLRNQEISPWKPLIPLVFTNKKEAKGITHQNIQLG